MILTTTLLAIASLQLTSIDVAAVEIPWTQTSQIRAYGLDGFVVPQGYEPTALVIEGTVWTDGFFHLVGTGGTRRIDYKAAGFSLYWPADIGRWMVGHPGEGFPTVADLGASPWISGDPLGNDIFQPPVLRKPLTWVAYSHGGHNSYPRTFGPHVAPPNRLVAGQEMRVDRSSGPVPTFWLIDDPVSMRAIEQAGVVYVVPKHSYRVRNLELPTVPYIPIWSRFRGRLLFRLLLREVEE